MISCHLHFVSDIAKAVKESPTVNVATMVGLHNGTVLIPTYDWMTFLGHYFRKLPQVKSYYHFRFHIRTIQARCFVRSIGTQKKRLETSFKRKEHQKLANSHPQFHRVVSVENIQNICSWKSVNFAGTGQRT